MKLEELWTRKRMECWKFEQAGGPAMPKTTLQVTGVWVFFTHPKIHVAEDLILPDERAQINLLFG